MLSNKKLVIEEIRRKSWVVVLLMLIALVTGPLLMLINYENWAAWSTREALIESMENYFIRFGGMGAFLCIVSAVLLGLSQFSYLFYKSKVDLYHSIPVKRSRRFMVNYIAGLITYLVCSFVSSVLMLVLVLAKGCFTNVLFTNLVMSFLSELIHFLYFYNVTIIAVMLTGNIVVCLVGIGVLSIFYYMSTEMITGLRNYYFVTSNTIRNYGSAFWNKFPELSPVTSYFMFTEKRGKYWGIIPFDNNLQACGYLLKVAVIVIITLAMAFWLFEKRPSEAAGKAMSFKKSQPFIRIPVALLGGLFGAAVMTSVVNAYKNGWVWFGLISGILLTHCIMEIVFNFNFKAVLNNKLQLLITLIAGCMILFIFQTDMFGYDKYIPDRNKIEAAAVAFIQLDANLSCDTLESKGDGIWESTGKSTDEQAIDNIFTSSAMIDKIYAVGSVGISCVDKMIENRYGENTPGYYDVAVDEAASYVVSDASAGADIFESDQNKLEQANSYLADNNIVIHDISEDYDENTMITDVMFRLKNGKTIIRRYNIPVAKLEMAMSEIYKSKEYKKVHFDLYNAANKGAISTIEAYDAFDNKKMSLTGGQMKQFMEIYTSELDKLTVNDLKNLPIGRISPMYMGHYYNESLYGYYLYPCFTKTLEYMDSIGVDMTGFTNEINPDIVQNMTIYVNNLFESSNTDGGNVKESVLMDDITYSTSDDSGKAMIDTVSKHLMIRTMSESNYSLIPYDGRLDIQIYLESENGIQTVVPCILKRGEIPEELINDLKIKLYKSQVAQ